MTYKTIFNSHNLPPDFRLQGVKLKSGIYKLKGKYEGLDNIPPIDFENVAFNVVYDHENKRQLINTMHVDPDGTYTVNFEVIDNLVPLLVIVGGILGVTAMVIFSGEGITNNLVELSESTTIQVRESGNFMLKLAVPLTVIAILIAFR